MREADQRPGGGGVTAGAVALADGTGGLDLSAEQRIDDGRLAGATGAEEGGGLAGGDPGSEYPGQVIVVSTDEHRLGDAGGVAQSRFGIGAEIPFV